MSDDDARILVQLQVTLAKIESSVDTTLHRVRNMEQAMLLFATRREMEQSVEVLSDRIGKLESRSEWLHRWLWGAWAAGLLSVFGLGKKTGLL